MKIAVCSLYISLPDEYIEFIEPNRVNYCKLHGYDSFYGDKPFCDRRPHWDKIFLIKKLLPDYDWVFWIDADAIIFNQHKKLESFIKEDDNLIIQIEEKSGDFLNSGVFLIKNTPENFKFLDAIIEHPERNHYTSEQYPVNILLSENFVKHRILFPSKLSVEELLQVFYGEHNWLSHYSNEIANKYKYKHGTNPFVVHCADGTWHMKMRMMREIAAIASFFQKLEASSSNFTNPHYTGN